MQVFNTLTRKKEELVPQTPGEFKIYCCGPTVYNYIHIGNSRPLCVFDVFRRYLEYRGYKVTFVQNFTDIDDKIIKRANEEGTDYKTISEKYIEEYWKDADGLNVRRADIHPRATEVMDEIIDIIQTLIDKGHAYVVENGDVYFVTSSCRGYGKLSHQPLDELQAGARINIGELKKEPMDFALWKAAKPGEPYWESPWGHGRPGWHIECSAMNRRYLGETIGQGPHLPAPRERDRAVRVLQRQDVRELLDAQRLHQRRQREDVQVQGQLLHGPRSGREIRV